MRLSAIAASFLVAGTLSLASAPALAQKIPSHLRNCQKYQPFERVEAEYTVPTASGGTGSVRVVSQTWSCHNTYTGNGTSHSLYGMKDASGKLVVPFKYAQVLPFSTAGALVAPHGDGPHGRNLKHRTYIAGKGEGKEQFNFQQAGMLQQTGGCNSKLSSPIGEYWFGIDGGRSHVTLFTPSGVPRKLEYMGGDGLKPAVQRVGDVLLARWRDDQGAARSGILDFSGRQIAPVLGNAALWSTLVAAGRTDASACFGELSLDLFIEGPSLDQDPSRPFYGPLLTPITRNGLPAELPKGAVGMFPAIRESYNANRSGHADNTAMWAVVFPTKTGFEFTLHVGTPAEALAAAATAPRFDWLDRTTAGYVMARAVADQNWRVYRPKTDLIIGKPDADATVALAKANVIIAAEAQAREQALAAAWAAEQANRKASRVSLLQAARANSRLCWMPMPFDDGLEWVTIYVAECDARYFHAADIERARAMAVPEATIAASLDRARRMGEETARQTAEFEAHLRATAGSRSSYIPGQWESALRNAGDAWADAIDESSDHWLKQRQDQYNADWQRSQRAY